MDTAGAVEENRWKVKVEDCHLNKAQLPVVESEKTGGGQAK
jgi:hypothetical protein